jgi:hypothetical protein
MSTYKRVINPIIVLAILVIQLATPTIALADDPPAAEVTPAEVVVTGTPLPPGQEEGTPAAAEATEAPPAETAAATEETAVPAETAAAMEGVPTPAEEVVIPEEVAPPAETAVVTEEVPTPAETAAVTEGAEPPVETAAVTAEETAAPIIVEVTPIVTEILEQAPAGTEVVALTNEGEVAPLDTLKAVEIIASSDPVWCPEGVALGDAACTTNQGSISDLINVLSNTSNGYTGNGTIYFQEGNYDNIFTSETVVALNHIDLSNLGNLTLWGGWDIGGTNTNTGTTTFSIPIVVYWTANITLRDIIVDFGNGGSPNNAIYVATTGDITLENVQGNNGADGADLVNYSGTGDVSVVDSSFSNNTNAGLNIISSGLVSVDGVDVSNNNIGLAVDNTTGTEGIELANVTSTDNAWTGIDARSSGNIHLDTVTASGSQVGAYLDTTHGAGAVNVEAGTFTANSEIGLKAITAAGNIQLTDVTTDSANVSGSLGAWLKSYSRGTITVTDSVFDNAETGLFIVGTNNVLLDNVSAGHNAGNGVEIQSGWVFACIPPDGINVTVDGGNYHNNGGYGFAVYPGPKGRVTLSGTITYLANAHGNSLIDLKKTCVPAKKPTSTKTYKVVKVQPKGSPPETIDCKKYKGLILSLPDGSLAKVICPAKGQFSVEKIDQNKLPGELPIGPLYVDSMTISLMDGSEPVTVLKDGGGFLISFKVPKDLKGKRFAIMYWDGTAKDGAGAWVELPREQFAGQEFFLHPKTPADGMKILRGVYDYDGSVSVKINFTGTFVLIAR